MPRQIENLRNIGIIAHIDAGKTTVTERMLYYAGATHKMGEVDRGTTETDFDPEEQQRGITIYSACVTFEWKDVMVNLIDTPGHVDFTAEVERSLRVLDGGVVVFSAREGVEAQSETVWRQANRYHVPRLAFINKLDREGADFEAVLAEIGSRLQSNPVAIQIPVGSGPPHLENSFRAVIDLIGRKLLTFTPESQGAEVREQVVPPELVPEMEKWRNRMLESLYDYSDELMEQALAEQIVSEDLIRSVLRKATIHNYVQPVLCGSALDFMGIQPLLDAVAHYLPSPADLPPVEGVDPKNKDKVLKRHCNPEDPFCGLLFKIVADKHGDLCYVRVYSGELGAGSRVLNPGREKKENVPQLWHIQADHRQQVKAVAAGDIVGIIGLRHSITGDTLCDSKHPILLETIVFPETVISMAIEPESSSDRKKLSQTLEMMKRQDPTFRAQENEETGQTLISGMGELHLEVIKHRLLRDFNLNVKVHKPRVSYRETVKQPVEATGECHRQIGGQSLFAKVRLRMEPTQGEADQVMTGMERDHGLPPEFAAVVLDELNNLGQGGGALGFPLMNVRLTLLGGEVHETESNETAFRIATSDAFHQALRPENTVLLEPIMRLRITTPEESFGDFMADLQQRRGTVNRTNTRGPDVIIDAEAPLGTLFGYSSAMRSLSQGRASCTMEPASYGPAPPEVLAGFL
ncbi:MAG: elongation factor G [Pirellulales bacterium]